MGRLAASIKKFASGLKQVSDKSQTSRWQDSDKLSAQEKVAHVVADLVSEKIDLMEFGLYCHVPCSLPKLLYATRTEDIMNLNKPVVIKVAGLSCR